MTSLETKVGSWKSSLLNRFFGRTVFDFEVVETACGGATVSSYGGRDGGGADCTNEGGIVVGS